MVPGPFHCQILDQEMLGYIMEVDPFKMQNGKKTNGSLDFPFRQECLGFFLAPKSFSFLLLLYYDCISELDM
jgi:hypothetical protein